MGACPGCGHAYRCPCGCRCCPLCPELAGDLLAGPSLVAGAISRGVADVRAGAGRAVERGRVFQMEQT
jgi:hypothetical protein